MALLSVGEPFMTKIVGSETLHAVMQLPALADQRSDRDVVEADVVAYALHQGQTVVVDHLDTTGLA